MNPQDKDVTTGTRNQEMTHADERAKTLVACVPASLSSSSTRLISMIISVSESFPQHPQEGVGALLSVHGGAGAYRGQHWQPQPPFPADGSEVVIW